MLVPKYKDMDGEIIVVVLWQESFFFSKIWKRFFKKKKRKKEREENGRCLTCDKSGIFKIVHEQMCIYIYQPLSTRSRVCSEALLFFGYRLIQSIYYNLGLLHFSNHKKKPRGAMKIYFNAHNTHHTPRIFFVIGKCSNPKL